MSEHTKGEWVIERTYIRQGSITGKVVCELDRDNIPQEELEANAHLIAAAPKTAEQHDKLLAACDVVMDRLSKICADGGTMQDFLNAGSMGEIAQVKATIAEAKGD